MLKTPPIFGPAQPHGEVRKEILLLELGKADGLRAKPDKQSAGVSSSSWTSRENRSGLQARGAPGDERYLQGQGCVLPRHGGRPRRRWRRLAQKGKRTKSDVRILRQRAVNGIASGDAEATARVCRSKRRIEMGEAAGRF
jgi:hypothetical protein